LEKRQRNHMKSEEEIENEIKKLKEKYKEKIEP
jgi:hypothetical protein